MEQQLTELSRFLSYVLRHKPQALELAISEDGWVSVDELIQNANRHGKSITVEILQTIVSADDKQRYSFNADKTKIRANQGHSVAIDLKLQPQMPPEFLYHGTAGRNGDSIAESGLLKQQRHHVHLSQDQQTAKRVGARYGKPMVLTVLAGEMARKGFVFYKSDNDVWLTDKVPPEFIRFPK